MNDYFTPIRSTQVLSASALLLILTTSLWAQQQRVTPPQPSDKTNADRLRQQNMSRREYLLRNLGNDPATPSDRRQLEALMLQTEQDFNRILTLHNQIVRAISSDQMLDYHFLSEAGAEIRKRANRLQSTLALQELEGDQKDPHQWDGFKNLPLKDSLLTLCKQIRSFVTNPVIETPGTVNAEQLEKARLDLAGIIKLSEQIKKDADRLSKTAK